MVTPWGTAGLLLHWRSGVEVTPPTWSLSNAATVSMTREKSPGSRSERGSMTSSRSPSSHAVLRRGYRSERRTSEACQRGSGRCPAGPHISDPGGAPRPEVKFLLGESHQLRYAGLQPAYTGEERILSATPRFPRIGGPLSTARSPSTVLKAPLPPCVRALVRSSLLAEHVLVVAGHRFTVGNWSLPMWRFHRGSGPKTVQNRFPQRRFDSSPGFDGLWEGEDSGKCSSVTERRPRTGCPTVPTPGNSLGIIPGGSETTVRETSGARSGL